LEFQKLKSSKIFTRGSQPSYRRKKIYKTFLFQSA
jgi:hypothetical protein